MAELDITSNAERIAEIDWRTSPVEMPESLIRTGRISLREPTDPTVHVLRTAISAITEKVGANNATFDGVL